jgi:hypothetical protein
MGRLRAVDPGEARNHGGMQTRDHRLVVDGELSDDVARAFEGMSLTPEAA